MVTTHHLLVIFTTLVATTATTTNHNTFCTQKWAIGSPGCPLDAVCVPFGDPENQQDKYRGYCSCSFSELLLHDKLAVDLSTNSTKLVGCSLSASTKVLIALHALVGVGGFFVTAHVLGSVKLGLGYNQFKFDVLGISSSATIAAASSLGISRISAGVLLSTSLSTNTYDAVNTAHVAILGFLTFATLLGGLFLGVAMLGILLRASRLMGVTNHSRSNRTAWIAAAGGGGVMMCVVLGLLASEQLQLVSLVLATCSLAVSYLYGKLAHSIMRSITTSVVVTHITLKTVIMLVVADLSVRFRFALAFLMIACTSYVTCWFVGRTYSNSAVLSIGIAVANLSQYTAVLVVHVSLALCIREIWDLRTERVAVDSSRHSKRLSQSLTGLQLEFHPVLPRPPERTAETERPVDARWSLTNITTKIANRVHSLPARPQNELILTKHNTDSTHSIKPVVLFAPHQAREQRASTEQLLPTVPATPSSTTQVDPSI